MDKQEELIAVIGMSCRFPQASSPDEFWENLKCGKESISFFSEKELQSSGVSPDLYNSPDYVNAACILDDIDLFDHDFFNYSMEEAELMDPQQRFFLECAYEALEDAGYHAELYEGSIGVFGGVRNSGYPKVLAPLMVRLGTSKSFDCVLGTIADQLCPRTSFTLNLKGPSVGVQTACSASIVAIHLASESLKNGECDMALAGATAIYVPQKRGMLFEEGMSLTPDGHCRAFDIKTKGCALGNGTGLVVLKRYEDAIADSDQIYAVICGSAVNNDGSSKAGFRAPSIEGQAAVIHEALQVAGIPADTISYVETNGTGTFIGDSMEVEALTRVFRKYTQKKSYCGIGSVKTNIGHLTQAAGIAGFIKTVLAMKHRQLPPSLNYCEPIPALSDSPFFVISSLSGWENGEVPLRAGINAFAIGGTNAHVIIEEPKKIVLQSNALQSFHLFTLSAKSADSLEEMIRRYKNFLIAHPEHSLSDICVTTNLSRTRYSYRFFATVSSKEELLGQLDLMVAGELFPEPKIGFILSDENFGKSVVGLYKQFPVFREAFDQCSEIVKFHHGTALYPSGRKDPEAGENSRVDLEVFAQLYSILALFISWGVFPLIVMGVGVGELVAACLAGRFTLSEALNMVSLGATPGEKGLDTGKHSTCPSLASSQIKLFSARQGRCLLNDEVNNLKYWLGRCNEPYSQENMEQFFLQKKCNSVVALGVAPDRIQKWKKAFPATELHHISDNDEDILRQLIEIVGTLYSRGMTINWKQFNSNKSFHRISLPTYPFERKRCWFCPHDKENGHQ
ncbi:type I polyketide synthase [Desulfobacter sp.]|uniref:type I polyketide synthase n=1 Tax=Desulfobacter sp. TaxID=2294 RepID=UPI003D0CFDD9